MNRETANVLLLLVGGALVKIAVDGSYVRYVKPGLLPYLLAAALLIIVLGIAAIARDVRRGQAPDADDDSDGHRHGTRPYWMLLVPAAVILFVAPPALGASSVGSSTAQQTMGAPEKTAFPPLPDGPAPEVPLLEVIGRAARDSTGSLEHRRITTAGFVLATGHGGSARVDGGRDGLDLARVLIICCAADARTIRVHLDGNLGDIPEGTWLSVTGVVQTGSATAGTGYTPTLTVTHASRIPAPVNTYAY
ncbi:MULTISPECIES: TIGR03943 family putative permease subunit [unclassified Rhodococcus (in: high G+C Gram-positive bacteria)]|uniref:TIGR03943 family putative permease subunit n=1 Tax=unclassified Rhodococcus (in: high G+C Gram-positive bacteria) TaxID=192944 RepID=UPI00163AE66E|nr:MULTISPECIES: TIGR03943 family protein [unclassified Rhodococcus (in: high G+C Gram-positive bacteria)]MBC2644356.1 TIGR03943 family protein [Rhodococcus sp. 3A]MBC2897952.1 TIGR03943 family protein [Rhodococcus sp. 4CII]